MNLAAMLVVVAIAAATATPSPSEAPRTPREALKVAFNAGADTIRVVTLLSPT